MEGRDMRKEGTIAGNDPANDRDVSHTGAIGRGFVSVPVDSGAGRVLKGSGVSSDRLGTADRPPAGAGLSQLKASVL